MKWLMYVLFLDYTFHLTQYKDLDKQWQASYTLIPIIKKINALVSVSHPCFMDLSKTSNDLQRDIDACLLSLIPCPRI